MKEKFVIHGNDLNFFMRFRLDFAKALIEKNYEVHLVVSSENKIIIDELKQYNIKCHYKSFERAGMNIFRDAMYIFQLVSLFKSINPKYMMSYNIKPNIYGVIAAWLARVPKRYMLITGLGFSFGEKAGFLKILVSRLYRISMGCSTWVFFQNPDDQSLFEKLKIIKKNCSSVVSGSGVNLDQYKKIPLPNSLKFIMVARILKDKGIQEYIEAAMLVRKQNPKVEFIYVGDLDDNPMSISKKQLDLWKASSGIKFYGQLKDVRPALGESSVFVLPSYREGIPRSVLEAMSMGRPIITTKAPGCKETVKEGYNGFLVDIKSVEALVTAMEKFINQPSLVKSMGDASRVYAEERFDVNLVNQTMISKMIDSC